MSKELDLRKRVATKFQSEVGEDNKFPCEAGNIVGEETVIGVDLSNANSWTATGTTRFDKLSYLNKNSRSNFNLRYCKLLDVNSPKISNGLSVGVDLYLPRFDKNFFLVFKKINDNSDKNREFEFVINERYQYIREKNTQDNWIVYDNNLERMTICKNCTIPSGIAIDIPYPYFMDLRPRSGCHKDDYTLILGTIDEDYTYGFGFQILLYDKCITFEKDTRIGQFLLHQSELIDSMIEINESDWNNDEIILKKRETRTGGFGSTGKK